MLQEKILFEVVKRALPTIQKKLLLTKEELEHYSKNKLIPYICNSYEKLNQSTSQLFRNTGYRISELYVPLTLISTNGESYLINKLPLGLLKQTSRVLIKDSAGMGKSTLLKMIFRYAVDCGEIIPFYIDLKSLVKGQKVLSVHDYILQSYPTFKETISKDFLLTLFQEVPYLFLFDGADEVPEPHKKDVFDSVLEFCEKASNSIYFVATRDEDKILSAFNSFESHSIQVLKQEEAFTLLRKYQFKDVSAENLINEIQKPENNSVLEFLENPLLTTLLYTAYSYSRNVPLKKSLFFSQIYEALYANHDATKIGYLTRHKKSGLSINEFERVLSHLAFISRIKEKLEYTRPELIALLDDIAQSHPTLSFDSRSFIDDLISTVPVMRRDGLNYAWQHKSIQEYFFVRYLFIVASEEQRNKMIIKLLSANNVQKFKLILDILYDVDEELFHQTVTKSLLSYWNKNSATRTLGNSYIDDSINMFYRYLSGPLSEIAELFDLTTVDIKERNNDEVFDLMSSEFDKMHGANNYNMCYASIRSNETFKSYSAFYESHWSTPLEILFSKHAPFVSLRKSDHFIDEVNSSVQNLSRLGSISELETTDITFTLFLLNVSQCRAFITELEKKINIRKEQFDIADL